MTADDFIKINLATAAWRAAREHGIVAMTAAMLVVRNRVLAGWYEGDWAYCMSDFGSVLTFPDPREPNFQKVLQLADSVYDGTLEDRWTCGAFYFGKYVRQDATKPEPERVAMVGQLSFYR